MKRCKLLVEYFLCLVKVRLQKKIWGKRHLAYVIEGNEEGYYVVYNLEIDKSKITEIQNKLKFMNDILRFLLVLED